VGEGAAACRSAFAFFLVLLECLVAWCIVKEGKGRWWNAMNAENRSIGVTTEDACPNCGGAVALRHAVGAYGGSLCYSASFSCPHCGSGQEADGDEIPPPIRALLEARDGLWAVYGPLGEFVSARAIARFLHQNQHVSLREASKLVPRIVAGEPVFVGLRPEAWCMVEILRERGVMATASPTDR